MPFPNINIKNIRIQEGQQTVIHPLIRPVHTHSFSHRCCFSAAALATCYIYRWFKSVTARFQRGLNPGYITGHRGHPAHISGLPFASKWRIGPLYELYLRQKWLVTFKAVMLYNELLYWERRGVTACLIIQTPKDTGETKTSCLMLWCDCAIIGRCIGKIRSLLYSSPHALSYDTLLLMDFSKVNFDPGR